MLPLDSTALDLLSIDSLVNEPVLVSTALPQPTSEALFFESIIEDLISKGYSIQKNALPAELSQSLVNHLKTIDNESFRKAGIGRGDRHIVNEGIRSDQISWIGYGEQASDNWLNWLNSFKDTLNQNLYLGLNAVESHFAFYSPGDFYKTHCDAFKGNSNRKLSMVTYLNADWQASDGGELVIYTDHSLQKQIKVLPELGTVVIFLSEDFPHEVLPATKNRFSIASWFRINEFSVIS